MIARRTALTVALLALASAAPAQDPGPPGDAFRINALLGSAVYLADAETRNAWDESGRYKAVGAEWRRAGRVADVVIRRDGTMTGLVAEVGGLLDFADKHVVVGMEDVKLVPLEDRRWAAVTNLTPEDLEARNAVPELAPE